MERNKALAVAGSVAVTLLAAGGAVLANVGLLEASEADADVGQLDAQTVADLVAEPTPPSTEAIAVEPPTTVVYVDEYVTADGQPATPPAAGQAPATVGDAPAGVRVAPPAASAPAAATSSRPAPSSAGGATASSPAPAATPSPSPTGVTPPGGTDDDRYEAEDHDDDRYEAEDHEDDEHEDDEHEVEDHDDD